MSARQLGRRPVLLVGHDSLDQPREPLSEHVMAVPYAPYAQIFPRASAIVHQDGIRTTGQSLRLGKPMLVVPFRGDQYDNGARIIRLSVGRIMRRDCDRANRTAVEIE